MLIDQPYRRRFEEYNDRQTRIRLPSVGEESHAGNKFARSPSQESGEVFTRTA